MPFTPAHPAIVLPFINRKFFSATGLIAGSISPDFEYFFKAQTSGVHGHTIAGLFYFDLPVCLLIAFGFHFLVKESFISNLPVFFQKRFHEVQIFDFKTYFKTQYYFFILSAMVGAGSHILWDSFTHNGTYCVKNLSFYEGSYIPFQGAKYPLWYALQHISTFTGLTIVILYIIFLPVNKLAVVTTPRVAYWLALTLLGALFFYLRFTLFHESMRIGNIVVTSISSILLSICIVGFIPFFKASNN
jgi:hypothetical protein